MGALSARVASITDASSEKVTVPEWGGIEVEVRSLTLAERNRVTMSSQVKGKADLNRFYAAMIIACSWDPESGEKAFDAADTQMLLSKSGGALDRVAKVAMRLSGLSATEDDDETDDESESAFASAVDEAGKGSSSTGTSGSGS